MTRVDHPGLADRRFTVVKQRTDVPVGFFEAEARGLRVLRDAGALRVPEVYDVRKDRIVLEDLGAGPPAPDYWQRAARGLAKQHAVVGTRFGFDDAGFCGDSPQDNTPDDDGWRFFAGRRLLPQMQRARDGGLIGIHDVAAIESVCARLRERVPGMPSVLLHGDLWSGNLHVCGDGTPALIDAGAVHFGWAEAELAMLTLFGSPPAALFDAYAERTLLDRDWHRRAPIYNVYHLLNHVNLFGTGYVPMLRSALALCA
ncbi:MAG TPA: fructosamine kinase family protein [Rhodanobacteraceae bacterium]|nr:fructosamine kinase family protein [Rhodanobacteraceae bacterium]